MDKLADIEKRHASHPLRQRDDFEKIAKEFRDKVRDVKFGDLWLRQLVIWSS